MPTDPGLIMSSNFSRSDSMGAAAEPCTRDSISYSASTFGSYILPSNTHSFSQWPLSLSWGLISMFYVRMSTQQELKSQHCNSYDSALASAHCRKKLFWPASRAALIRSMTMLKSVKDLNPISVSELSSDRCLPNPPTKDGYLFPVCWSPRREVWHSALFVCSRILSRCCLHWRETYIFMAKCSNLDTGAFVQMCTIFK